MPKASRRDIDAARRLVRARDDYRCQLCGFIKWTGDLSVHHRLNRGRGGSSKLERASILVTACGDGTRDCHGQVTENPEWARSIGWLLPRNNPDIDPTREPILLWDGWYYLSDDGSRTPCTPSEVPA
jgi:hypothetical protein